MADKKISALTASTTPLAGTEVLPIVQSGATVKVAVSDLTAGRAVSATQLTLSTGNLVVATTAKGVTTGSSIPLGFGVNNTVTAITIDTSSNVGIGTTTPTSKLDVNGAINLSGVPYLATDGTSNYLKIGPAGTYIQNSAGSTTFGIITNAGNLGLGTSSPAATALLDVQSPTKGVRFPNMTTTQKNAITPSAGTVVFDTTLAKLCVYSGAAWQTITSV